MNVECNYSKIAHITLTVAEHHLVKYRKSCTLQLWSVERDTGAVYNSVKSGTIAIFYALHHCNQK